MSAPPAGRPALALLYLPPILNPHADDELALLGRKLALSLDKFAADNAALYESAPATITVRGTDERVCRLTRRAAAGGPAEPLADLILVDYRPLLMARYRTAGLGRKVLLAAVGLWVMAWKGLGALRHPRAVKLLRDRFQTLYALACFSLVFVYLALLLATGAKVISAKFTSESPPATTNAPPAEVTPVLPESSQPWLDFGTPPPANGGPRGPGTQLWFSSPGVGAPLLPESILPLWSTNGGPAGTVGPLAGDDAEEPGWGDALARGGAAVWDVASAPWKWFWKLDPASTGLLFLVLTALGLAGGQGQENRWRTFINRASEEMLAFIYYLSFTDRRAEITGLLESRLEQLMEAGLYERFGVVGYSFGTVVALDAFCPASEARARRLAQVSTLVTIASPYDFILTYWPTYFADRQHAPPPQWLNVYSPVDLLGTCFDKTRARVERAQRLGQPVPAPARDDLQNSFGGPYQLATGPTREFVFREGIPDEQLGLFGWIAMQGLGAHSRYWSWDEDGERNCFDLLAPALFPDAPAAAAPPPPKPA